MGGYRVRAVKAPTLRQRFHVRLESVNGRVLMWSEKYRDASWARLFGAELAERLACEFVDETAEGSGS